MKCFYHNNDHDGHCSKEIIRSKYPKCELIGVNYGDGVDPLDLVKPGELIFVCDFCFQPFSIMEELSRYCTLILFDHHKTAEEDVANSKKFNPTKSVIDLKRSGCEITWNEMYPDKEMPRAIRLLGRYDVFDIEYDSDVLPFEYGLRSMTTHARVWNLLFRNDETFIKKVLDRGEIVLDYLDKLHERMLKTIAKVEFKGHKAHAINYNGDTGLFFRKYKDDILDGILITYSKSPNGSWNVGLVADKESNINVGSIAKEYGGGGHVTASGFSCDELPFTIGD